MTRVLRTVVGLFVAAGGVAVLAPQGLPVTSTVGGDTAPQMATFVLRIVATGLCGYVALVLLALLLAELQVLPRAMRRTVDRWTGGGLARGIRQLVGASVLAVGAVPLSPMAAHATEAPVIAPIEERGSPPVMRPVEPSAPEAMAPREAPVAPPLPPARPLPQETPSTITVQPGESFWSIAEDLVALRLGHRPTDEDVIGPWLDLIERNVDVLADPGEPDLLLPGAVLRLPAR
jgi:hypothetical protein